MKILFNLFLVVLFSFLSIFSYKYMQKNIEYNYKEPNIEKMVKAKTKNGYLDKKIEEAIRNDNFDDVESYIELSNRFNIKLYPKTIELIKENNTTSKKLTRGVKNFTKGFIKGEANSSTQVIGAIASDFTLYGDLRDIHKEGSRYINNQPYDKLILGLSMAGVALSASQLVTLGASSTAKVGISTLKLAKKEKLLTNKFSGILIQKIDKSVNLNSLKKINFSSIKEVKNSVKIIKNSIDIKPLKPIFHNLNNIKKSTSLTDTIHLLKYIDNEKDLTKIAKFSKKYKGSTKGIFKLFGKNSIRAVKAGIKWGKNLILSMLALGLSLYGLIISLIRLFTFK